MTAKKFWVSFRVEEKTVLARTADQRRTALNKAMVDRSSAWWAETTSFFLIESSCTLDQLMAAAYRAVSPSVDLVLIRELDAANAFVIGPIQHERILARLMPYVLRWIPPRTR